MTNSSSALAGDAGLDHAFVSGDLRRQNAALRAELDELQPVITAAVLAATAFRLRDQDALSSALRMLVRATHLVEEQRAAA